MSTGDVVSQFLADRVSARGLALRNARRSLFGAVDHAESEKFVKDELDKQYQLDREKWNFDFSNEEPLNCSSKRYEWTQMPASTQKAADGKTSSHADDSKVGRINGSFQNSNENAHLTGKDKQLQITDFMRKRKHSGKRKVDSPEAGVCATKRVRRSST